MIQTIGNDLQLSRWCLTRSKDFHVTAVSRKAELQTQLLPLGHAIFLEIIIVANAMDGWSGFRTLNVNCEIGGCGEAYLGIYW